MIGLFDRFARPLLRAFDPEDAHRLALQGLRLLPVPQAADDDPKLAIRAFGLNFPNPVGIAAGFDKNAEVPGPLLRLGFGFVEVGTVTPRPQTGNPRPRLFRLDADEAVINRLGFNNEGEAAVLARLAARANEGGIVGVNIGANRDSADRVADYVRLIEAFAPVASYVDGQCVVAQHAGPARPAAGEKPRRSAGARDCGARPRARARGPHARAAQDRARPDARRARRHCRASRARAVWTA